MKKAILVQCRMGSSRLPGKSLFSLTESINVVDSVFSRISKSKETDNIIFCIPKSSTDITLAKYLQKKNIIFFRGNDNDLIKRFGETCKHYNIDQFVRVTADNPLVDPEVIDYFFSINDKYNFIDGYSPKKLPNGTVISRFNSNLIYYLDKIEKSKRNREHIVTCPYLLKNNFIPKIPKRWSNPFVRYCLDNIEDYNYLKKIFLNKDILNYNTEMLIKLYETSNPENIKYAEKRY